MTITAAMTTKPRDEQSREAEPDVGDLWSTMNVYHCNFWFLGVDQATEMTESFRELDGRNEGESFTAEVKVPEKFLLEIRTSTFYLLLSCCRPTGDPGDSGVRSGSSDRPAAAG